MVEQNSYPATARETVTLAAMAGLATGIIEGLGYLVFQKLRWLAWDESLQSVGPQQVWISAAFNLLLFTAVAVVLLPLPVLIRWPRWPRFLNGVFTFLFFFMLFAFSGRVRTGACAILALGLAWQLSGRCEGWWSARRTQMPRLATGLAAIVLLYAGGLAAVRYVGEKRAIAQLAAAPEKAPNVLLVVLDTVRADHLSAYGYPRATTPNLDKLAKEGVLFERAYPGSSWSLPSHATMLTGRLPFEHRATARGDWKPLDGSLPTLAQVLGQHGYASSAVVANTVWASPWTGLDYGFHHYDCLYGSVNDMQARTFYGRMLRKFVFPRIGLPRQLPARTEQSVRQQFLQWLDANPGRPFFAFLNFMAVHDLRRGAKFAERFKGAVAIPGQPDPVSTWKLTPEMVREREETVGRYDGALAFLDDQVGQLVEELRRRNLADNTLLILTSDHGEHLGEQALTAHGNSLYEATLRVPLILRLPGRIPAGVRVAEPVSLQSLSSTVMDLTGVAAQPAFPAPSLSPAWSGGTLNPDTLVVAEVDSANFLGIPRTWPVANGWVKCLITSRWKLIWNEKGSTELYDLSADPGETKNLATTADGAPVAAAMLEKLRSVVNAGKPNP